MPEMSRLHDNSFYLEMKFLNIAYMPKLMILETIIAENLPSQEIFLLHDQDFFRMSVSQPNSTIGIFAGDDLIAYSILRIPRSSDQAMPDNLGMDINLPPEDLIKVAHIQAMAVHPDHRGNGLQRKLARAHLALAEDSGYHHIFCTVSPKNPKSLANMLSCGFLIEALRPKFQGWFRFILHKDLKKSHISSPEDTDGRAEQIAISINDLEGQQSLLRRGFKGSRIVAHSGIIKVIYERARSNWKK